ncbi:MAG: ATP-binding cassette domain-containing protein [Clostridiales bacterium]|nr:ATP-binding cassette domain-containing protein [Clostridiales bacterium]
MFKDVSFEIKGGSTVALVGPSGSGKSTLTKLLYNFYEPTEGRILINDIPINSYNIVSLRNVMSIVSQDIFIFNGTVRDNLVFGREGVSEEDIKQALVLSESYDFVMNLHDGLDTYIGERGGKIIPGTKAKIVHSSGHN